MTRLILSIVAVLLFGAAAEARAETPLASLQQAIAEALEHNPEIQAARREHEAAVQRIAPSAALDDPMLEAGVVNLPTRSWSFHQEDMTMKMVGVTQRLPYPGKRALRQDVAAKEAEAASYSLQEVTNRVRRDVQVAYFDMSLNAESMRITENNRSALEQLAKVAEARYGLGQASQADVLKAQAQLSKMNDELIRLDRERRITVAELNKLMGQLADRRIATPSVPPPREVTLEVDTLRESVQASRPDLQALQTKIERNEKAVDLARKDYYPDFDVRFFYGQRDKTPTGERRDDMIGLTVAVNLPIWGEAKQGPRVAEAIAMREQAVRMYEARRNEVLAQLKQQIAAAEQSYRSARLYETTALVQARLAVESALASYRVNRVDFLTLLDNQMNVFNYEIGYATAVVNQLKALAEIEFITGRPIPDR